MYSGIPSPERSASARVHAWPLSGLPRTPGAALGELPEGVRLLARPGRAPRSSSPSSIGLADLRRLPPHRRRCAPFCALDAHLTA